MSSKINKENPGDGKDSERKEILLYALQREDALVNNRLIWVLTIQGFLFAAVALAKERGVQPENFIKIIGSMGIVISCMGTTLSVLANRQINGIKLSWGNLASVTQDVSPFGSGPHKKKSLKNYFGLSFFLPVFTGIAWVLVLLDTLGIIKW